MEKEAYVFPASFAQRRLLFLDQLEPGNPVYNIAAAVRLRGRLDPVALERSLNEVVARHESLRTVFTVSEGEPLQVIIPSLTLGLPVLELPPLPDEEREAEVRRLAAEAAQHPFDLAEGPLLRASLVRAAEEEHVLLLTVHHIVSDGWSMGVLVREVAALYEAFTEGKQSPLAELPLQYADYAQWQREWLQGETLEAELAYWREQLAGAPPMLELPTDRPRPPLQTYRGEKQTLLLSEGLTAALRELSRREGCTLFMTLLAAFKLLLYRHTGQEDIVVGSPIAGRTRAEIEDLIGFFLNTLVLRTRLSGELTFRALLGRVREVTLGAYAHQDVPFEQLLEELQPERDLSRTPLFQVFFNMMNFPELDIRLPGLEVKLIAPPELGSKFDLTLYVEERGRGLAFEMVWNAELFRRARAAEMLEQLRHLLTQVAANPDEQLGRFSLVTPTAEQFLPNPALPLGEKWEGAVHELFARHARRAPGRTAVRDSREVWTYGELEARSNQLARRLIAGGVRPEDRVAIYASREASLVWALLGVMKAGAAFVVLDPAYPASRLADYVALAQPRGWLQLESAGRPPAELEEFIEALAGGCRLTLPPRSAVEAAGFLAEHSTEDPGVVRGPDDLAYISFTSGSTGMPKGIMGRHGPLTHFLPWLVRAFGLDESDRYSMLSGLSHDPLHRDIFTPMQLGACICVPDAEEIETPGQLAEWMRREGVTVAHLTPAMGQVLTERPADAPPCEIGSLRYAFFVGDILTRGDVAKLQRLAPGMTCVNYYGSTETQRAVSYYVVPAAAVGAQEGAGGGEPGREVIPLGRGIEDVQLLVLNPARQLAGVGEVGEIYFRSPHLARGYLGDETLTRERFIPNWMTGRPRDVLYRTGDLGRYMPDGNVEPLGRADHQVKIRGFRVELGEIEALLGAHPSVHKVVVIAREDRPGDKRLAAYVVAQSGRSADEGELRDFLRRRLPDYMVPQAFVMLDSLPLTPNGKVDRRALPEPTGAHAEPGESFVAPRTTIERELARVWSEVLGVERVGVNDNFFKAGGHSLLAIQLISRLYDAFGVKLSLRRFFESPTVAGLSVAVVQAQAEQADRENMARILAELEGHPAADAASSAGGA
ncbi:MAG: amino acid adenylation domain-containing protein [Acidobacteriota bacterium]|nr:amino acid adenylation domain-containing protein [Acidobacteriota bacterium]